VAKVVNAVPMDALAPDEERCRRLFVLRQMAGLECKMSLELLFCSVISSKSAGDLRPSTPFRKIPIKFSISSLLQSCMRREWGR
jgi:hypothetical protein